MSYRVIVCASGGGSNLGALFQAFADDDGVVIVAVLSNRSDAGALNRARVRGVPGRVLQRPDDPAEWVALLDEFAPDLIVLAGYLQLVPPAVVERFRGRIINIHPSLLPAFGGSGMYGRRVHVAVIAAGARESGASVHLVDEDYDRGMVLAQQVVPVHGDDTPESLGVRVLAAEHALLPRVVRHAAAMGRPAPLDAGRFSS